MTSSSATALRSAACSGPRVTWCRSDSASATPRASAAARLRHRGPDLVGRAGAGVHPLGRQPGLEQRRPQVGAALGGRARLCRLLEAVVIAGDGVASRCSNTQMPRRPIVASAASSGSPFESAAARARSNSAGRRGGGPRRARPGPAPRAGAPRAVAPVRSGRSRARGGLGGRLVREPLNVGPGRDAGGFDGGGHRLAVECLGGLDPVVGDTPRGAQRSTGCAAAPVTGPPGGASSHFRRVGSSRIASRRSPWASRTGARSRSRGSSSPFGARLGQPRRRACFRPRARGGREAARTVRSSGPKAASRSWSSRRMRPRAAAAPPCPRRTRGPGAGCRP